MKGLARILLAEDDENDVELTLSALESNHLANAVVTVGDGAQALDYLYRRGRHAGRAPGNPVVILLDLKMPRVDGFEVLERVKADPSLRVIPVVVLTSSRETPDIAKAYGLGANGYVVKPVVFNEFVEAVREVGAFWAILNEPPAGSVGGGR